MRIGRLFAVAALAVSAGCAGYSWKPDVPDDMRTVSVPTFRNESDVTELGAVASGQIAREFQREGTFAVRRTGDAAIEIQGSVVSVKCGSRAYQRRLGLRNSEFGMTAEFRVSVIDKVGSRVLVDGRTYRAQATFVAHDDIMTGERNASGRLAEDLARQVVDDVLALNLKTGERQ